MSYDEDTVPENPVLDGTDILAESLKIRKTLGWEHTNISELYAFTGYALAFPNNFLCS